MQLEFVLQVVLIFIVAFFIQGAMFNAPASWTAVALHRFSRAHQNRPNFQVITLALKDNF